MLEVQSSVLHSKEVSGSVSLAWSAATELAAGVNKKVRATNPLRPAAGAKREWPTV